MPGGRATAGCTQAGSDFESESKALPVAPVQQLAKALPVAPESTSYPGPLTGSYPTDPFLLQTLVSCPLTGLDLSGYDLQSSLCPPAGAGAGTPPAVAPAIYDCYAVVNHYGQVRALWCVTSPSSRRY